MWRVYPLRAHYRAQSGSHVQNSTRCGARAIKTNHDAKNRMFMRLWRSVDFHSVSSRAKMKYKTLFTLFFFPPPLLKTTFVTVRVALPFRTSLYCITVQMSFVDRLHEIIWYKFITSFGAAKITWHYKVLFWLKYVTLGAGFIAHMRMNSYKMQRGLLNHHMNGKSTINLKNLQNV